MCKVRKASPEGLSAESKYKQIEEIRRFLPMKFDANGLEVQPIADDVRHALFITVKFR